MSLTSLLKKNRNVVRLFSLLPDLNSEIKVYQPVANGMPTPYVARHEKADPALVGCAYDFWCRAYIQRENKEEKEIGVSKQVIGGLTKALDEGYIAEEDVDDLLENIHLIWKMRSDFINGDFVNEDDLLKGCLVLSYFEATYRNGKKPPKTYLDIRRPDLYDLKNLSEATKSMPRIFRTKNGIHMNPTFGEFSRKVGGADADYIIGNMLVDIKTSQYETFKKEYLYQLVGYYLLATYDETFPCEIKQLGVFYPRFKKLVYVDVDVIEKFIKLDVFSKWFRDIIEGNENALESLDYKTMKRKLYK